ncbi:ATP-dependent RNA helicase [Rhodococcus sp. RD6.2]|uniref:DEAD/DEAH box helicase n=1 Tax=Rhodococcus sp. RD6.2 TaxID=260936 RepID=UPI00063B57DE|nr:DEAD/DEAH box helicase [Rhodococcus sp. RD6.2]CRK51283.1 ATP-dependent RNA helicase [Rhodococcus sp. RD6.2]
MTNATQDNAAHDQAETTAAPTDQSAESATVTDQPTFAEIGLPAPVVASLARDGITVPSPIQAMAIPDAIAGRNVLGRAQTGSGKTLAFGLPMLARLAGRDDRPAAKRPRALVLVPTRELAVQVVDSLHPYASTVGLKVRSAVGGMVFTKQVDQLARGVDILVATPGRLGDHLRQETCILDEVEMIALDEADQMADMGFLPEVRSIIEQTRPDGQRLLFSATLDREVQSLVRRFLPDHVEHATADGRASVTTMEHYVLNVDRGQKDAVLAEIGARNGGRTIMFARTKLGAEGITERLREVGVVAEALHGGKAQNQRTRVLERFKTGRTPILVATDVAARGIHVDGIDLVVHVDPPADHKDYLHRAGRTARAGEKGTVVSIVLPNQRRMVQRLTDSAGVDAVQVNVRPGSEELTAITGAQKPSGEPVRERRERSDRGFGDRPRREGGYQRNDRSYGDRSQRGGDRSYGDRPQRNEGGYRGNRDGGNQRSGDRSYGDRPQRSEGGYRGNNDRSYGDRPQRDGGYQRSGDRSYGDRPQRSEGGYQRSDRSYGDRPQRSEGGYRGNNDRSYGDRPQRSEGGYRGNRDGGNQRSGDRSYGDRPQRSEGGYRGNNDRSYGDRPQRDGGYQRSGDRSYGDRPQRSEGGYRGNRDGGNQRGGDRSYGDRPRGDRSYGDRPQRDGYRSDRPQRDGGFQRSGDRPQRTERTGTSGGFRSRTERRSYDGFDGPVRDR